MTKTRNYILNGVPFRVDVRQPKRAGSAWVYVHVPGFKVEWTTEARVRFKSRTPKGAAK